MAELEESLPEVRGGLLLGVALVNGLEMAFQSVDSSERLAGLYHGGLFAGG